MQSMINKNKQMKNIFTKLIVICVFASAGISQPTVQGTIKKDGNSCVGIYAKPSANITNSPTNYVFSISIPNQSGMGESNPTTSITELLPGMILDAGNPAPFSLNGRRYYDFNITEGSSPPAVNWVAGMEYKIAKVCFSNGTPAPNEEFIQVNDLAEFGNFGYTDWYVEFLILGPVSNDSNPYYASAGFSIAMNGSDSNAETLQGVSLPIRLLSFQASKAGERSSLLQWTTTSEQNSDFFQIERSADGVTWESLGTVKAAGNSQDELEYRFLDDALPFTRSEVLLYYRLRLVDTDGKYSYSEIKGVNFRSLPAADLALYPNPAYDLLNVDLSGMELVGTATLDIYDAEGKIVLSRNGLLQGILLLDISGFAAGNYYLHYTGPYDTVKKSFIKVQR
jgi:hypothetical protein